MSDVVVFLTAIDDVVSVACVHDCELSMWNRPPNWSDTEIVLVRENELSYAVEAPITVLVP
jgi:hypothetical protein